MTGSYLYRSVSRVDNDHPDANTRLFVDDTSMFAEGDSCYEVVDKLVPALASFKRIVDNLKLKLSPKASITASSSKLLDIQVKECKNIGVAFERSTDARDLGVSNTAGRSRPGSTVKSRFQKSRATKIKNSELAKVRRASRKPYSGYYFLPRRGGTRVVVCLILKCLT